MPCALSPWYNSNGWLGVKYQLTCCQSCSWCIISPCLQVELLELCRASQAHWVKVWRPWPWMMTTRRSDASRWTSDRPLPGKVLLAAAKASSWWVESTPDLSPFCPGTTAKVSVQVLEKGEKSWNLKWKKLEVLKGPGIVYSWHLLKSRGISTQRCEKISVKNICLKRVKNLNCGWIRVKEISVKCVCKNILHQKYVKTSVWNVSEKNLCEMCMYVWLHGDRWKCDGQHQKNGFRQNVHYFSEYSQMLCVKLQSLMQSCMQLEYCGSAWKWRTALYERKTIKCVWPSGKAVGW